jgi:methylthioribulose-1-phosphate dehydratase
MEVRSDTDPELLDQERLGQELLAAMAEIHRRGWCDGTGGNFSCLLRRDPLELLMAPSGVDKGSVAAADLIVVNGDATVIHGNGKASAETLLHLAVVQATGAGAVLHTHSQAATLLSRKRGLLHGDSLQPSQRVGREETMATSIDFEDLEMLKGLEGITTHATRVRLPVLANDQDLSRLSARARAILPSAPWGLLIAGHGLYAWGRDLATARRHLEILEFLLEQRWRELILGSSLHSDVTRR